MFKHTDNEFAIRLTTFGAKACDVVYNSSSPSSGTPVLPDSGAMWLNLLTSGRDTHQITAADLKARQLQTANKGCRWIAWEKVMTWENGYHE